MKRMSLCLYYSFSGGSQHLVTQKSRWHPVVEKEKIAKNGDYNLAGERYKETVNGVNQKWPMMELGEVCEIRTGKKDVNQGNVNGKYPFFTCAKDHTYSDSFSFDMEALLVAGNGDVGAVSYYKGRFEAYQRTYVLSEFKKVEARYLFFVLKNTLKNVVSKQKLGNTMPYIKLGMLTSFQIPLPPLEIQHAIVAELESYQKIIDGARQVVDNYQVYIKVPSDCDVVTIGDLCQQIQYGISEPMNTEGNGFKIFRMQEIKDGFLVDNGNMKFADIPQAEYRKYKLNEDDILFNRTNSYQWVGRTGIFKLEGEYCFASYLIRMVVNKALVIPDYINYFMNTGYFQTTIKLKATRAIGQANINARSLAEYELPLPSLDVQKQMVAQIEQEQKLVEAAKKLIEIFEQKIQDKIAEVWGTDLTPNDDNNAPTNGTFKQAQPVQQAEAEQVELGLG